MRPEEFRRDLGAGDDITSCVLEAGDAHSFKDYILFH